MRNIDDKLREIAPNVDAGQWERVKQAFADEGEFAINNISFEDINKYSLQFVKPVVGVPKVNGQPLMTGQEFYDRFLKELPDDSGYTFNKALSEYYAIKEAAKRAAGLDT